MTRGVQVPLRHRSLQNEALFGLEKRPLITGGSGRYGCGSRCTSLVKHLKTEGMAFVVADTVMIYPRGVTIRFKLVYVAAR